jgi:hypothetical protein
VLILAAIRNLEFARDIKCLGVCSRGTRLTDWTTKQPYAGSPLPKNVDRLPMWCRWRANAEHADRLLATLADAPLSTRELNDWFEHYQKASRASRDRMVSHPRLFLDALRENVEQRAGLHLRPTRRRMRRRSVVYRGGARPSESV